MATKIEIRFANEGDCGLIFGFIKSLAFYEELLEEVTATEGNLRATLIGHNPSAEC